MSAQRKTIVTKKALASRRVRAPQVHTDRGSGQTGITFDPQDLDRVACALADLSEGWGATSYSISPWSAPSAENSMTSWCQVRWDGHADGDDVRFDVPSAEPIIPGTTYDAVRSQRAAATPPSYRDLILANPTSNCEGYYNAADLCVIAGITLRTLSQWEWATAENPDFPGSAPEYGPGKRRYYSKETVELVSKVAEVVREHHVSDSVAMISVVDGVSVERACEIEIEEKA